MQERSWRLISSTKLGNWSIGLVVLMPILFLVGTSFAGSLYKTIPGGKTVIEDLIARPILTLTMLAGMAAGVAGFVTGLIPILKKKEKAVLVYLSTAIGGLFIVYLIAELAFPH